VIHWSPDPIEIKLYSTDLDFPKNRAEVKKPSKLSKVSSIQKVDHHRRTIRGPARPR